MASTREKWRYADNHEELLHDLVYLDRIVDQKIFDACWTRNQKRASELYPEQEMIQRWYTEAWTWVDCYGEKNVDRFPRERPRSMSFEERQSTRFASGRREVLCDSSVTSTSSVLVVVNVVASDKEKPTSSLDHANKFQDQIYSNSIDGRPHSSTIHNAIGSPEKQRSTSLINEKHLIEEASYTPVTDEKPVSTIQTNSKPQEKALCTCKRVEYMRRAKTALEEQKTPTLFQGLEIALPDSSNNGRPAFSVLFALPAESELASMDFLASGREYVDFVLPGNIELCGVQTEEGFLIWPEPKLTSAFDLGMYVSLADAREFLEEWRGFLERRVAGEQLYGERGGEGLQEEAKELEVDGGEGMDMAYYEWYTRKYPSMKFMHPVAFRSMAYEEPEF